MVRNLVKRSLNTASAIMIALTLGAGLIAGAPATRAKAEVAQPTFDDESMEISIGDAEAGYLYIGVVANDAVKAYDMLEVKTAGTVKIDISSYSKKGVTLKVYQDTVAGAKTIAIAKNETKWKLKYYPGKEGVARIDTGTDLTLNAAKHEFRLENGAWTAYDADALNAAIDSAAIYGGTIYFREVGVTIGDSLMFASVEGKVKISKMANAPKATIDYNKLTVKLPKKIEVLGIKDAEGEPTTEWEAYPDATEPVALSTLADLTAAVSFKLRTAATDDGKKGASKIFEVKVGAQGDAPVKDSDFTLTAKTDGKIDFKNSSEKVIEYTIGDSATSTSSWKKVNAGATGSIAKTEAGKKIWVRFASVKANASTGVEAALVSKVNTEEVTLPEGTSSAVLVTEISLAALTTKPTATANSTGITATVTPDDATNAKVKWVVTGSEADKAKIILYSDSTCTTTIVPQDTATDVMTVYVKKLGTGVTLAAATTIKATAADSSGISSNEVALK